MSMNERLVRKIVSRVKSGKVKSSSYTSAQVQEAFAQADQVMTDDMLRPWVDAKIRDRERDARDAKAQETNKARRKNRAVQAAARLEARRHQIAVARAAGREMFESMMQAEKEEDSTAQRNPVNAPLAGVAADVPPVD